MDEYLNIGEKAYYELFDGRELKKQIDIKYSGHFKGYNANVKYTQDKMTFALSKEWQGIDEDIQIGLIQSLLLKVYKVKGKRPKSFYIDLYDNFLKHVHISVPVTKSEPLLEDSFDRINDIHFDGLIEPVNLVFGSPSARLYGSYEYGTDTISINPILLDHPHLLDYVMYHEMLHKKFKYKKGGNLRTTHHTKEFRLAEEAYPDQAALEKELGKLSFKTKYTKKARDAFTIGKESKKILKDSKIIPKKSEENKKKRGKFFDWF